MGLRRAIVFSIACLIASPWGSGVRAAPPAPGAAAEGVAGEWTIQLEVAGQTMEYSLELSQSGEKVRGDLVSPRSKKRYPIDEGSFKDSTLRFKVPEKGAEVVARLVGEKLEGTVDAGGLSGKFSGLSKGPAREAPGKKGALAGKWRTTARLPNDREMSGSLEVVEREGKLSGTLAGERGSLDLKSIAVTEAGKVLMALVLPTNSGDREVSLEASFDGPDRLKGRWSLADGSATGEWSARRESPPRPAAKASLLPRYRVEAKVPGGDTFTFDLRPRAEGGKLAATITLEGGSKVEVQGSCQDGKVEFEWDVPYQGQTRRVKVDGEVGEKGVLQGSWRSDEGSGEWIGRPVVEV